MQTFLPYADFKKSAQVLDGMRLGKQRVETLQIMQALLGLRLNSSVQKISSGKDGKPRSVKVPLSQDQWTVAPLATKGWRNHPATLMWVGHEISLLAYQEAICHEWTSRGYSDSCLEKTIYLVESSGQSLSSTEPPWLGWDEFHRSHQSNLLRKDYSHYTSLFPGVTPDLPYVWPARDWPPISD